MNCMYAYEAGTGRIMFTANYPVPEGMAEAIIKNGMKPLEGPVEDIATWYVKTTPTPKLTRRPINNATWVGVTGDHATVPADGQTIIAINTPANTQVYIDDELAGTTTGTPFEITAETPGDYKVMLFCWPYLEKTLTFTAS